MLRRIRAICRAKLVRAIEQVVAEYHAAGERLLRDEIDQLRSQIMNESRRIIDFSRHVEIRDRRDLIAAGERSAAMESASLAQSRMTGARHFRSPAETLDYSLSLIRGEGMALEFGVHTGATLSTIAAACPDRQVYGFDSFAGLPHHWRPGFPAGTFALSTQPEVAGAEIVAGLFHDTLPPFLRSHPQMAAFIHLDADLYSSTRTVLHNLYSRMRPGTILVFDEYFNYPGWRDHEYRAWDEFVSEKKVEFAYEAYTYDNEQVVVRVTDI
jgi:predicted O-methyltransferase YrrM